MVSFKLKKRVKNLTERLRELEKRKKEYEETDDKIKGANYKKFEKEKKRFY